MAVLYQYTNPFKAVTDTMRRANHEPHCNRMIQGELVSWNCIRGSLQPNPGPCCMFGFLTFRSCQLKKKWHGLFLFHICSELSYRWCVAYAYRLFYQQTYGVVKLGCHCFPKVGDSDGASVWLHVSELFWWTDMLSIKRVLRAGALRFSSNCFGWIVRNLEGFFCCVCLGSFSCLLLFFCELWKLLQNESISF